MATLIDQNEGEAFQAKGTSGLTFERTKEGLEHRVFRAGRQAKNGTIALEYLPWKSCTDNYDSFCLLPGLNFNTHPCLQAITFPQVFGLVSDWYC